MDISTNAHLVYLIDQIRSNPSTNNVNRITEENSRARAWLLTTLSIYGDQFNVLIDLYRLFREQHSYTLLTFIIEHILKYHINEIDTNNYLQEEFQLIFTNSSQNLIEIDKFSYSHLYSLMSTSIRNIISSLLLRKWHDELEKCLLLSLKSDELFNQCREKALACLSLSSSLSTASILQLIINTEDKIGFNTKITSLNILRCLFVQDLLPIVLENRQQLNIQSHLCHKWLIYALEFYLEYLLRYFTNNQLKSVRIQLEGSHHRTYQCDNPMEQIEKLINLSMNNHENFNWQQFIIYHENKMYEGLNFCSNQIESVLSDSITISKKIERKFRYQNFASR